MANNNKYNKVSLTGMFDSNYGYSVRVTPEVLEKLNQVKAGGFLQISRVKEETRERIATEQGKDVLKTIAAYLEFAAPSEGTTAGAPAPKAVAKPVAVKGAVKVERF